MEAFEIAQNRGNRNAAQDLNVLVHGNRGQGVSMYQPMGAYSQMKPDRGE